MVKGWLFYTTSIIITYCFKVQKMSNDLIDKQRETLCRHIENVQRGCSILGERLIERNEDILGHKLIANGYLHDNSKFYGIEWKHLHTDSKKNKPELFQIASFHHITINKHHPEYWDGGIHKMPRLYLCELICDWNARSSEFGNDIRTWVKKHGTKKYNMIVQSTTYKEIKELINILLDSTFV